MYILYFEHGCPYCNRVITFIRENNIKVEMRDRDVKKHEADLIKRGGKRQVPYLVDPANDVEMYESADIIEYLKKNLA